MKDDKILDFQTEAAELNAAEILRQMFEKHKETGESGMYSITPNGNLGEKLRDL